MDRALRYHLLFDCDVREAARWYDRRSPGLGDRFAKLVREATDEVIANPEQFPLSPSGCRFARVARFPYVLFEPTAEEIRFLAVLHTARSMEKWRERLSE
jgi:plasmid stabilization system protein ParE